LRASFKSALVLTTAAAIALTCLDLRPAAAAPEGGATIVKQRASAEDFSAARKRRRGRGVNPAIPLAAFGAIMGTIGSLAAEQRRRDYYERYYDGPYYAPPQQYYAPAPVYRPHYGYHGGYGHPGYQRGAVRGGVGSGGPVTPTDRVAP
jgi:hypothetical protein